MLFPQNFFFFLLLLFLSIEDVFATLLSQQGQLVLALPKLKHPCVALRVCVVSASAVHGRSLRLGRVATRTICLTDGESRGPALGSGCLNVHRGFVEGWQATVVILSPLGLLILEFDHVPKLGQLVCSAFSMVVKPDLRYVILCRFLFKIL